MKQLITFLFICLITIQRSSGQDVSLKELDLNLENYEYPFPVAFLALESQDEKLQMAYMDIRPVKPNGKTVMLLHGKNFNGAYWKQTAKVLSQAGYRVVIPDQIGFGKSSKPIHFQYSFHQLAAFTKQLLDKLNIPKTAVLGHSMGGMVAARFALMYPHATERLILENPIGLEDYKLHVPFQSVDRWYQSELKSNLKSIKEYQINSYYHGEWKDEYTPWLHQLAGWTLSPDYPRIAWNSALTYDMIYTQPVCYELDQIKVPTLLIIGQLDRSAVGKNLAEGQSRKRLGNYPALGKATQQKINKSKLIELEGIGHLPHIENFEKFITPLLAFLNQ